MRRRWVAALVAGMWLVGCGGKSLPSGANDNTDGTTGLPGTPADSGTPGDGKDPQAQAPTLWPLTQGSSWTYKVTDPALGNIDKTVVVEGPGTMPGMDPSMRVVLVHSTQLRQVSGAQEVYEERSWQVELTNGLVVRLREDDSTNGVQTTTTRWTPTAIMKSLAREQQVGWTHTDTTTEVERVGKEAETSKERTYKWQLVAVESVTVPAGTFPNALKLVRTKIGKDGQDKSERTYWLVPGVGKVKEDGERLEELQAYDVKK